jgi:hypothetical protein
MFHGPDDDEPPNALTEAFGKILMGAVFVVVSIGLASALYQVIKARMGY